MRQENNSVDYRDISTTPEFPVRYHHLGTWYADALKWLGAGRVEEIKLQTAIRSERLPWNMPDSPSTEWQFAEFAERTATEHAAHFVRRWGNTEIALDKLSQIQESTTSLRDSEPETFNTLISSLRDILISTGHIANNAFTMGAITIEHRYELANLIEERASVVELEKFCSEAGDDYEKFVSAESLSEASKDELEDLEALKKEIAMFKESSATLIETIKNSKNPESIQALIGGLMFLVNYKHLEVNLQYEKDLGSALFMPQKLLEVSKTKEKEARETLHYIADLYGENPSLSSEATLKTIQKNAENKVRFLKLAQSNPDAKIQISGDPDLICASCSGGKEFGDHCTQRAEEGEVGADLVTKNVLGNLYASSPAYLNLHDDISISHNSNGNEMFEIPIRLLFDQKFIFALEQEETEYYKQLTKAAKSKSAGNS